MLTAVILTKNEEKNIKACIETLRFADEILIVDDESTDDTVKIIKDLQKEFPITLLERKLDNNFSEQRNVALSKAKDEWVLFIDADERVSKALADEITKSIENTSVAGFYLRRVDFLWGKQLKHGDTGNTSLLRLAKKDAGEWKGIVHEVWEVKGETGRLKNSLLHYPHQSLTEFLTEVNYYTTLRAEELFEQKQSASFFSILLYTKAKFFKTYILQLGILDGMPGLLSSVIMSFHSFLVRSKLYLLYDKQSSK